MILAYTYYEPATLGFTEDQAEEFVAQLNQAGASAVITKDGKVAIDAALIAHMRKEGKWEL